MSVWFVSLKKSVWANVWRKYEGCSSPIPNKQWTNPGDRNMRGRRTLQGWTRRVLCDGAQNCLELWTPPPQETQRSLPTPPLNASTELPFLQENTTLKLTLFELYHVIPSTKTWSVELILSRMSEKSLNCLCQLFRAAWTLALTTLLLGAEVSSQRFPPPFSSFKLVNNN